MPRIAVTSDLHFDDGGYLTPPAAIEQVADAMKSEEVEAVVLLGDVGHPLHNFTACLDVFGSRGLHVGVVPGNHDVWRDPCHDSRALWETVLPQEVRARGFCWLEQDPLVFEGTAIIGSIGWYDYSAADSSLGFGAEHYAAIKHSVSNDSYWIDWPWDDVQVAALARERLVHVLSALQQDPDIERVVVGTHVPLLEQQMHRDPSNPACGIANAYFGNLRTGREILRFGKLCAVLSGHLHSSKYEVVKRAGMADVQAIVIGSDYGAPAWLLLEI